MPNDPKPSVSPSANGLQIERTDCLLLNPPDLNTRYPYLGIALLAALLRANGIRAALLDSSALNMSIPEVVDHVKRLKPRIVGVSVMSLNLRRSYLLLEALKTSYPEGVIVVGGAHVDAVPESVRNLGVRYGFQGECEHEFLEFCKSILGGKKPPPMPGFIMNSEGDLNISAGKIIKDIDSLPRPAYDLLPIERYFSPSTSRRTVSFISSRGCPYKCIFCSKLQQKPYRHLSAANMLSQLDWLVRGLGVRWIEFVDEIFTLHRAHVIEFCEAVIGSGLAFEWGCGTRADRVDKELLTLMKRAGCRKVGFGIETGLERIRNAINKGLTNKQILDAVEACRLLGIKTQTCFIFGHPGETLRDMRETVRFARGLRSNYPTFLRMIPIPGSDLFESAKRNEELPPEIWNDFMLGHCDYPIYTPRGIDPKDVHRVFRGAWFSVYLWPPNLWVNRDVFLSWKYLLQGCKAFLDFACTRKF